MPHRLPTHTRLALIGATGVLAAVLAAACAFNAFESWHIEGEAIASVEEASGWQVEHEVPATRVVSYLTLDEEFRPLSDEYAFYTELEFSLARWCAVNAVVDEVARVRIQDAVCYVELTRSDWYQGSDPFAHHAHYLLSYVDVTSQLDLISSVNGAFLLIALVSALGAGYAGWRAGLRIEAADAAQRRFFENVSHELKTPLAVIAGYAEGMAAHVVDEEVARASIARESKRMARLVGEILDLSRLEAGSVRMRPESIAVSDLVQDCLMPFEGMVSERGLEVSLHLAAGQIEADPELATHALENVVANAIRHAHHRVELVFDGITLTVSNDGEPLTAEEREHMFDRFYSSASGGTGIGLAKAKEVAELHGWRLTAEVRDEMTCLAFTFA